MEKKENNRPIQSELSKTGHETYRVPRFSFLISVVLIGILLSVLSENLTIGPSWIVLAIAIVLLIPLIVTILRGHHKLTRVIALSITGVVTAGLISSVFFLVHSLFSHTAEASSLFRNAAILWVTNIVVFGVWYWEIDQGGPIIRHTNKPEPTDFLFPQLIFDAKVWANWKPGFLDYLFLAFNTSTAFSPTDTMVMSRRVKLLMMTQSSISLIIVAVLAARAINIA